MIPEGIVEASFRVERGYEMLGWGAILACKERYQDRLREAEKQRVIQQMLARRENHYRWYHRAVIWMGRRMVTWGASLLERHGAAATGRAAWARNPRPVNQCVIANCRE
jgi:hypothetical protein